MSKNELLISVIVPIYKVEDYLEECINSIIAQTYTNLEIILVDDGSPDECPNICDKFAKIDARIKVIHKINGGLVAARKAGVKIATGDYITFVDGDDWLINTTYEEMVEGIVHRLPDILCCGLVEETRDKRKNYICNKISTGYYEGSQLEQKILPNYLSFKGGVDFGIESSVVCKLFKAELMKQQIKYVNDSVTIGEDVIITLLNLIVADNIVINNDIYGYFYRCNDNSMTKKYNKYCLEEIERLFEGLDKIEGAFGNVKGLVKQLNVYKMYMLICYGMANEACGSRFLYFYRIKIYFEKLIDNKMFLDVLKKDMDIFEKFEPKKKLLIKLISRRKILSALMICVIPRRIIEVWNGKI